MSDAVTGAADSVASGAPSTKPSTIGVEVAHATPARQIIVALVVPRGTTARQAVQLASRQQDLAAMFPDMNVDSDALGIFGQLLGTRGLPAAEAYVLEAGDRVEIYRPLVADPKAVRRQRAARARNGRETDRAEVD